MELQEAYRVLSKPHQVTSPQERQKAKEVLDEAHQNKAVTECDTANA